MQYCVFDIETSVIPNVGEYAEAEVQVPSNYRDPDKISKYIEEAKAKNVAFAALDVDLGRVVCIGWTTDGTKVHGGIAKNEDEERALLTKFWTDTKDDTGRQRIYIGFNILDFDLPMILRRSLYLGVPAPQIAIDRFRHPGVIDLMQILTWNGKIRARKLDFYAQRFALDVPKDPTRGADVPGLVAVGEWDKVKKHCALDVRKEHALARKLGIIHETRAEVTDEQPF